MGETVTIQLKDLSDYLEEHGLQIKPGSLRFERDPAHPRRERLVAEFEPRATTETYQKQEEKTNYAQTPQASENRFSPPDGTNTD